MAGQTVHLQGIGRFNAIPAGDLVPGVKMVWNYGYTSKVVSVERVSPKTVRVVERSERGVEGVRTMRSSRLVAVTRSSVAAAKVAAGL
jgi:hypothetical protein